ncbi:MAG TPA: response regulator transcription factor [Solirubrobacteraceae bacterium]|jgi:DNA-binding NarL/FixJ family response regulator|nr:response regulator transcription factor [Solirubrobacteraceae bacterium]
MNGIHTHPTADQSPSTQSPTVALIAGDGPGEKIAEALSRQELDVTTFEEAQTLLAEHAEQTELPLILLWTEDSGPTLARSIEPLIGGFPQAHIVVICPSIQRWAVRSALAAGAVGVVLYDNIDETLGPCLRAVLSGQVCVPRIHSRQVEPPALSAREKQILGLVVMGYMNSQIADQLFLAESTIKSHLSSAFAKLGVRSRHEAVNLIVDPQQGWGMGILGLGGEPIELSSSTQS